MNIPKIENMQDSKGNRQKNQFIIQTDQGLFFKSYNSIIAFKPLNGPVILDAEKWDFSNTTGTYRNIFLRETKKETEKKIKSGIYKLENLNK